MSTINLENFCKKNNIDFIYKEIVTSTMDLAKLTKSNKKSLLIVSNEQLNGKGRSGNKWESQKGNIFLTLKIDMKKCSKIFSKNSIITSLVLKKTLDSLNIQSVFIKWPNDIFIGDKKIAGILIESYNINGTQYLLIGIGINYSSSPKNIKKTTYIKKFNPEISRDEIITLLIYNLLNFYNNHDDLNDELLFSEYKKSLLYINKNIKVKINKEIYFTGKFNDITKEGYLVINNENTKKTIVSGSMELIE